MGSDATQGELPPSRRRVSVCGRVLVIYHERSPTLEQAQYEQRFYANKIGARGPGAVLILADKAFPPPKQAVMASWRDFATHADSEMLAYAIISPIPKVGMTFINSFASNMFAAGQRPIPFQLFRSADPALDWLEHNTTGLGASAQDLRARLSLVRSM